MGLFCDDGNNVFENYNDGNSVFENYNDGYNVFKNYNDGNNVFENYNDGNNVFLLVTKFTPFFNFSKTNFLNDNNKLWTVFLKR